MNVPALIAVVILAIALLAISGSLYMVASRAHRKGELDASGLMILRWGIVGHIVLYLLLAITAFLTTG